MDFLAVSGVVDITLQALCSIMETNLIQKFHFLHLHSNDLNNLNILFLKLELKLNE